MTTLQSVGGAATFVRVVADVANGATAPSTMFLRDGISIQPDTTGRAAGGDGGFTVRTSDLPGVLAGGMIQSGGSTQQLFASGILAGSGVGSRPAGGPVQPYTTTLTYDAIYGFLRGVLATNLANVGVSGVPIAAFIDYSNTAALTTGKTGSDGSFVLNIAAAPGGTHTIYVQANYLPLATYGYTK